MAIIPGGGELLEPLHHVVLETALLVVYPDTGGDVHRGHEAQAFLHLRRRPHLRHPAGDVYPPVTPRGVEPEGVGVAPHPAHPLPRWPQSRIDRPTPTPRASSSAWIAS